MNQHIISRFYLGNFCDSVTRECPEPSLWTVDFQKGTVKRRAPKNIASQADYYSFRRSDGTLDSSIETMLSHIERKASSVIVKIQCRDYQLTEEERTYLALFMAFFVTRVPLFRKFVEQKASESGIAMLRTAAAHPEFFRRLVEKTTCEVSEEEIELQRQIVLDPKNYSIRCNPEYSLSLVMPLVTVIAPIIFDMQWLFLRAPENARFLTADAPVIWDDPYCADHEDIGLVLCHSLIVG